VTDSDQFPLDVLDQAEVARIYQEGRAAYRAGKYFHESPYAHAGASVPDDEYQRGYEWRRGWNDDALADGAVNLGRPH
jgi:hypothetical protein